MDRYLHQKRKVLERITSWIELNNAAVINNLTVESIDVYLFLKRTFEESNVNKNLLFQFVFRSFYRLDNAGLTPVFKEEYFKIFQEIRTKKNPEMVQVLERLYQFPTRRGLKSVQFSFTTKMFNMLDENLPIYDSQVARMFEMNPPYQKGFKLKVQKYLEQFESIKESYQKIIDLQLLPSVINLFNEKFAGYHLSEVKKLDFILWSSGKMKKTK